MTSGTGLGAVQAAFFAQLTGDSTVSSLVTGVFDAVPEGQPAPYIAIGEATEIPNRAFGRNGHELTVTIHGYDQDGVTFKGQAARGFKRLLALMNAVIISLESMTSGVTGFALVEVSYEFGQPIREEDADGGVYRHMPARFRVVLEDM